MRMGQGVRTGLGHGGITCVLQTQFSSLFLSFITAFQLLQYSYYPYNASALINAPNRFPENTGFFLNCMICFTG